MHCDVFCFPIVFFLTTMFGANSAHAWYSSLYLELLL
jgi:hypothetical protein